MIDLHCHMLPGIDDGAPNLDVALEMARIAVRDGIQVTACTPHIYPGLYENDAKGIQRSIIEFREQLLKHEINLKLVCGADVHLDVDLVSKLKAGKIPSLHGSRYFLLEPPHHVAPPRFEDSVFDLSAAGYVPIITHPERLTWIEGNYAIFKRLALRGVWMQITAGSLTGRFGSRAKYWGEKMLDDGMVHLLATDAHSVHRRAPILSEGVEIATHWVGAEEASNMVRARPCAVLENAEPGTVPQIALSLRADDSGGISAGETSQQRPRWWSGLFAGRLATRKKASVRSQR